jgi:hypothetical protein
MNYLLSGERFSKTCHYASIIAMLHVLWVTKILCRNYNTGPLMAAGGPSSFCLGKRNQNRCQQKCFALGASALQNGQNLGWNYFAPRLLSHAHAKTSYALQPHHPALFCPFSPEAVLLTLWGTREPFRIPRRFSQFPPPGGAR